MLYLLPNEFGKRYSKRNLWLMLKFYELSKKMQAVPAQLSWSHYCELLPINSLNEINYYIKITIEQNLGYRKLREKIKSNEYERLPKETKFKLLKKDNDKIQDYIKNPIIIKNNNKYDIITEKVLQRLILEDMNNFLLELGDGFCYIKNEYKIKIGDRYNYIDLLLFNYKYNSFVVIELKITELRKEYVGQIHTYMNYIDANLKTINHNNTIGIIICKKDNKFIMEYCTDNRILSREYQLI